MHNYLAFNLFRKTVKFKVVPVHTMKRYGRVLGMAPRILVRNARCGLVHLQPGSFFSLEKVDYYNRIRRERVDPREGLLVLRKKMKFCPCQEWKHHFSDTKPISFMFL